jgi:membrane-associated phospholipid phosphatase
MRRKFSTFSIALLVLLFLSNFAVHAQTPRPSPSPSPTAVEPVPSLEHEFFRNVLRDQKAIWTAPFHLKGHDAKWMVPLGLGTMALFTTDRITGDEIAEFDRPVSVSRAISYAGAAYSVGAVAATFYIVGRTSHNKRARETGILGAEALIDSMIVGGGLKLITQRARPQSGADRSEFFEGGTSFPSGHAIHAWSVATVIAKEYHDRPLVQVAAYGIAGAVSVARVTVHKHYISDALIGSLLGYGIGQYVYRAHHVSNERNADAENVKSRWPMIAPQYNRNARAYGVALTWSF